MINLSDVTLDFPCPYCRHKFYKTVGWAETHSSLICPICGRNIQFNTNELRNAVKTVRAAIANFRGAIEPVRL
jgi:transcription elongation factor Elf1